MSDSLRPVYPKAPEWKYLEEITDPAKRQIFEEDMAASVRDSIERARSRKELDPKKDANELSLKRNSIQILMGSLTPDHPCTFASWYIPRGILLGGIGCDEIGKRVCREAGFTAQEAAELLSKLPAEDSQRSDPLRE